MASQRQEVQSSIDGLSPLMPNLLSVLQTPAVGSQILECVRHADIQRLCASSRTLNEILSSNYATISTWLRNVEFLYCVPCKNEKIRQKIITSMRQHPNRARFVGYDSELGDDPHPGEFIEISRNDLRVAYELSFWWAFELYHEESPGEGVQLATLDTSSLSELSDIGAQKGAVFDFTTTLPIDDNSILDNPCNDSSNDADEAGRQKPRKKRKTMINVLKCSSSEQCCCRLPQDDIDRSFYVRGKPYCGYCIDRFDFLKLRFYAEQFSGRWNLQELEYFPQDRECYEREPPLGWGMKDDEFRVDIFSMLLEGKDICFIGVGPRGDVNGSASNNEPPVATSSQISACPAHKA